MGTAGDRRQWWTGVHADAWIGLLETHKRLTREVDAALDADHGLSISSFELLTRLASAEDRTLRLTTLANEAGLSLSRVSRILDGLERRGLIERRPCPEDTRAKNAWLTPAGVKVQQAAESVFFSAVKGSFFDQVSDRDLKALARVFGPFRRES